MKWLVTGDTHGAVATRLMNIGETDYPKDDTAIIILGDAGINFYLNKTDKKNKKILSNNYGYFIYCVRGNHEERPENIPGMEVYWDEIVDNYVYCEHEYPNIRYFMDGKIYNINGWKTLVIGGAYSVDKWYRLSRAPDNAKWTGWFPEEQLTTEEMATIEQHSGQHFDFILSHTCPESWQPFDLFLQGLDQSTVDKTMEVWMEKFKNTVTWDVWLFGHFHDDRLVRPHVEMFYTDIEDMATIYHRWTSGEELPWWLPKDPNYEEVE